MPLVSSSVPGLRRSYLRPRLQAKFEVGATAASVAPFGADGFHRATSGPGTTELALCREVT